MRTASEFHCERSPLLNAIYKVLGRQHGAWEEPSIVSRALGLRSGFVTNPSWDLGKFLFFLGLYFLLGKIRGQD